MAGMRRWQFSLRSLAYVLTGACLLAAALAWMMSSPRAEELTPVLLAMILAWAAAVIWMSFR